MAAILAALIRGGSEDPLLPHLLDPLDRACAVNIASALVGSSNLTRTALREGVEWNGRVVRASEGAGFIAGYVREEGLRAAAAHSGESSAPRDVRGGCVSRIDRDRAAHRARGDR